MAGKVKFSATLFNNPLLSDVKIKQVYKGKTREYHAHKAILCSQSEYFINAFTGIFKETTSNEMELQEDDPDQFEFALKFIYTEEYDKSAIEAMTGGVKVKKVLIPIGIYTIADKYDITRLFPLAFDDVLANLQSLPHQNFNLLRAVIELYYDSKIGCAADTPIGTLIASVMLDLCRDFIQSIECKEIMRKFPWFAADIALVSIQQGIFGIRKLTCVSCELVNLQDTKGFKSYYSTSAGHCLTCRQSLSFY